MKKRSVGILAAMLLVFVAVAAVSGGLGEQAFCDGLALIGGLGCGALFGLGLLALLLRFY